MTIDMHHLLAACADDSQVGGVVIETVLEPLGGPGTPVKPAVYAGGRYQLDERWVGEGADRSVAQVVVIDNVPSQANRLEAALESIAPRVGLPTVTLDLSGLRLPPHLPQRLSGFRMPHRQADAYLRDGVLNGEAFEETPVGKALMAATSDHPDALFEWFPQALLFGFWQSHLGKKRSQAKLARSWVSEIVGVRPASVETKIHGVKGDPLNLSVDEKIIFDANDLRGWTFAEGEKKADGSKKQGRLSEIGHGQVPFDSEKEALAGVSCQWVGQRAVLSLAGLRRIWCGSPEANAAGRALVAAIGLAAHAAAFGRPFSLRSGCDLRPRHQTWTWLGDGGDETAEPLDVEGAVALVQACAARAEAAGLAVGSRWQRELVLQPNAKLVKAIAATYPIGD